jgi:hypothetical protein
MPPGHKAEIEALLLQERNIFEQDILLVTYSRTPFESYSFIGDVVSEMREKEFSRNYEYQVTLLKKLGL